MSELNRTLLKYDAGTLVLAGQLPLLIPPQFTWDPRVEAFRAPAVMRRAVVDYCARQGIALADACSSASALDLRMRTDYSARPYQQEAFHAWEQAGRCGTIVLPTGSGKTFVALAAMAAVGRSTLVVAPTIDLMSQWYALLVDAFRTEVGILGGGYHEVRDVTVTTYDSAFRYAAEYGNRFDLVIFDEVHHLPSPSNRQIPLLSTAWCRLGLTATYEREDGAHAELEYLIGPVVYQRSILDLKGDFLADYEVIRIRTTLLDEEAARYAEYARQYHGCLKHLGLNPYISGWEELVKRSGYDEHARKALVAKAEMKRLVVGSERKLEVLDTLLKQHHQERVLIFTEQNDLVYRISREFLLPAITYQTKTRERKWILDGFKEGTFHAIVTSKVLNEGIDVPAAKVAVILSGSASPREHVQRLGRILRKGGDRRRALLYEVVTSATDEVRVSRKRRQADAYA
ncbi:MAG TPA: DEAD/DEAH box helicase family protein [Armatimonadota bacterium]